MSLFGKCLCESVAYEITGPARVVVNCHCSRCRRHTGHSDHGEDFPEPAR